jgi:hypothetical protein
LPQKFISSASSTDPALAIPKPFNVNAGESLLQEANMTNYQYTIALMVLLVTCHITAASGAFSCIHPLLGWLSSNMHSTAAAGLAIALNVSR